MENREMRDWDAYLAEGGDPSPILPTQKKNLCSQFWGRAWNLWLPQLTGYEYRMPRGRALLRAGKIIAFTITPGEAYARVIDGALWHTRLFVKEIDPSLADNFCQKATSHTSTVVDLLHGTAGDDLMRLVTDPDTCLFPERRELRAVCDCLDDADICPHSAALLYAIGVRLDTHPSDFFLWRRLDISTFGADPVKLAHRLTAPSAIHPTIPRTPEHLEKLLGIPIDHDAFADWLSAAPIDPP